jgi:hypothetical protein
VLPCLLSYELLFSLCLFYVISLTRDRIKACSLTFVALRSNPSEYIHGLRDLIKSIVIADVCLQVAETVALSS